MLLVRTSKGSCNCSILCLLSANHRMHHCELLLSTRILPASSIEA